MACRSRMVLVRCESFVADTHHRCIDAFDVSTDGSNKCYSMPTLWQRCEKCGWLTLAVHRWHHPKEDEHVTTSLCSGSLRFHCKAHNRGKNRLSRPSVGVSGLILHPNSQSNTVCPELLCGGLRGFSCSSAFAVAKCVHGTN